MDDLFQERTKWLEEEKLERCQTGDVSLHMSSSDCALKRSNLFFSELASIFDDFQQSVAKRVVSTDTEWTARIHRYV